MRTSRVGGVLASALLVVGAAACGGNEDAGAVGEPEAPDAATPETDGEVSAPETTAEEAEPQGPGGYPVREDEEAAATADRPGPRQPVKVTYQASGAGSGETMTLVFDGDRFAIHLAGGEGRIISTPDGTIFCGEQGEGCFEAPGGDQMMQGMAGAMGGVLTIEDRIADETLPDSWRIVDGRSVAGRDTTCAEFDAAEVTPGETGTMRYCFDESLGIGLYWEGTVDGETQSFEATSVETPTDADFEPTGPVSSSGQ